MKKYAHNKLSRTLNNHYLSSSIIESHMVRLLQNLDIGQFPRKNL